MNNQYNLTYETDLNQGLASTTLPMLFLYDDSLAHVFTVKTTRDGKPNSLAGSTVHAYFMPSNSEECVYMTGTVDENGYAVVSLEPACYAFIGRFSLVIRAEKGSAVTSIFRGEGYVGQSHTDAILDPGEALPSLAALEARINALDAAKAPAGYGLGDSWNLATDFNAALTNGWWYGASASGTVNFPTGFTANCACFVVARGAKQIYQYFFYPTNGCVVQRYTKDGGATWGEEWINPPMALGVEYRTTERWNGKVVYAALVDVGTLPNKAYKDVTLPSSITELVDLRLMAANTATGIYKVYNSNNEEGGYIHVGVMWYNTVRVYSLNYDASSMTGIVSIKYTKT